MRSLAKSFSGWLKRVLRDGIPENQHGDAAEPTANGIRQQLQRIKDSKTFQNSDRLKRFLEYTITEHLEGRERRSLKEFSIGLEVFDKDATFDVSKDSTVRSGATRLRNALDQYYKNEGQSDPILIEYPKGGYAPEISPRVAPQESVTLGGRRNRVRTAIIGGGMLLTVLGIGFGA